MPPGFSILYGGQYEEQQAARRDFTVAIVMALVLVYMLMAAQFERFVDPLIVIEDEQQGGGRGPNLLQQKPGRL